MTETHIMINYFIGQVLPNLIASALWSLPTIYITYRHVEKKHKEREDRMHNHITQQYPNLTDEELNN